MARATETSLEIKGELSMQSVCVCVTCVLTKGQASVCGWVQSSCCFLLLSVLWHLSLLTVTCSVMKIQS